MAARPGVRLAALVAAVATLALTSLVVAPPAGAADPVDYRQTKTLTREHVAADGTTTTVDSREVTVQVDRTQSLRGRERIHVSWSGARPSAGRSADPYGFNGMNQEYPVVILQCRGVDDASAPEAERLSPETCWTSTYLQRYAAGVVSAGVWRHDRYASDEDRADQETLPDWPAECGLLPGSVFAQHLLPFEAASGTVYPSCSNTTIAPESAIDAALPPADIAAFTNLDGTGDVQFEMRTSTENESLGCSSEVPCTLVVIPIMGLSCLDADAACTQTGDFAPGSSNLSDVGVDDAVSPRFWWSESNWRNRFSVPLSFALPPDACDVLDSRAPVGMYGSELLNQASLQWAPAYCLRADRFKFQHNRMPESAALRLLGTGDAVAAFVSDAARSSAVDLAYAPTAVTGFGVAFVADLPDNAGEVTQLRMTPRLLAKLLTQSYPATNDVRAHEGLENNPLALNTDPEFIDLNPGLSTVAAEAKATILSLSEASDVMTAVTAYIAADPEAMAFLGGEPDPWGMRVNPSYQDIEMPREDWPMLDTYVRESTRECEQLIRSPYLGLVAAPVNSLRKISEAVLDAWPNVQTQCTRSTTTDPWKFGRIARQNYGVRFMLGLVSLGDAERYGLRTAELRTDGTGAGATFVAPSVATMSTAVAQATQPAAGKPFTLDRASLDPAGYPGTMIVSTAARVSGLTAADAGHVAQFIRTATTEGQVSGPGNGQLPDGFVPIASTGPTAALYAAAQQAASTIEAQKGPAVAPPITPATVPLGTATGSVAVRPPAPRSGGVPVGGTPQTVDGLPAPGSDDVEAAASSGTTVAQESGAGGTAVKATLGLALAGVLGAPLLRSLATRRRAS
ncbi:hypothetical protein [Cellulomonas sp.]|uniref:hypothetical protein n=1 Tax=Cellulomonas sp. TaxID=40001 RepID=UPI003BA8F918